MASIVKLMINTPISTMKTIFIRTIDNNIKAVSRWLTSFLEAITFTEYLCVAKFWEEIEQSILEEDPPNQVRYNQMATLVENSQDSPYAVWPSIYYTSSI